jgi:hypothetical protein
MMAIERKFEASAKEGRDEHLWLARIALTSVMILGSFVVLTVMPQRAGADKTNGGTEVIVDDFFRRP